VEGDSVGRHPEEKGAKSVREVEKQGAAKRDSHLR